MYAFFLTAILAAQSIATAMPQTTAAKAEALDREVPAWLEQYDVPSAGIAYIEDGEIAFVRHYGEQEWGVPASEETLYNVASLTKPVTAETVLRLAGQGRFDIDAPLAVHHLDPDIAEAPAAREVTAALVMRHRMGLPNWRYETEGTLRFLRAPDVETGYSGEGYEWMAQAVGGALGAEFEQLARTLVMEPAGMEWTSYTRASHFFSRIAFPYKAGESVYNVVRDEMSASDDMRTTPREYARFMLSIWETDHVPQALRARQFTIRHYTSYKPQCPEDGKRADFCPENQGWGLGWYIYDYGDRRIFQHDGGDVGEKALAFYDPDARRGAVVLTNGANGHEVMHRIGALLDGDPRFGALMLAPFG
ncbi:MAG: serine hydrolase domain-containing protein [Parasphingopyxis sp.]|uniref:serine hydrolase domain-containing protein n=1 Tax=Parasphingopyxis sp. TaxID=1920299 RepID=UPI003F9F9C99